MTRAFLSILSSFLFCQCGGTDVGNALTTEIQIVGAASSDSLPTAIRLSSESEDALETAILTVRQVALITGSDCADLSGRSVIRVRQERSVDLLSE